MMNRKDDTEQRAIIAILLSLAVYWMWQLFFVPSPAPVEALPAVVEAPAESVAPHQAPPSAVDSLPQASDLPERSLSFSTSKVQATLTSEGGGLSDVILPNQEGPYVITPIWKHVLGLIKGEAETPWRPYGDAPGPEEVLTPDGLLLAAGSGRFQEGRYALLEGGDATTADRVTSDGIRVTKSYTADDDGRFVDVSVSFENTSGQSWTGPLWVGMSDVFDGEVSRYKNATRPSAVVDGDLEHQDKLEKLAEGPIRHEGAVSWFGIADRYFMAAAVPEAQDWGALTFAESGATEGAAGAYLVRDQTLTPGQRESLKLRVYIGSKDISVLRAIGHDLAKSVDFGFFGFFSNILLWILNMFHSLVGNWGLSIILLTVSVKASFWPLTQKSFKSSRAMQAVQPRIAALKEKYGDDAQKLGEEQMKIFREEGVNPLSGCLPMVIQMPVWFALYSVLLSSSDVYHAEFLYLKDLSSADPMSILPVMVGIFYFVQQRIMPTSPNMDPTQQKIMRMMPMMFVVFMFAFPSGLNIYILINTLLSITQMWLINRAYPVVEPVATPS